MKTLRFLRNVAALFILGVTLLASGPGVELSHAQSKFCAVKAGKNCSFDFTTGKCTESSCVKGQPCNDSGCVKFCDFICK